MQKKCLVYPDVVIPKYVPNKWSKDAHYLLLNMTLPNFRG